MGISTVQSRPSSSATRGRGCIGPFIIWGRIPAERQKKRAAQLFIWGNSDKWAAEGAGKCRNCIPEREVYTHTAAVWFWLRGSQWHAHTWSIPLSLTEALPSLNYCHHLPHLTTWVDITHIHTHADSQCQWYDYPLHLLLSTLLPGNRSFHPMRSSPPLSYHHAGAGRPFVTVIVRVCVCAICTLQILCTLALTELKHQIKPRDFSV